MFYFSGKFQTASMILVADSGATKTDWVSSDASGKTFRTEGINPSLMPENEIGRIVSVASEYFCGRGRAVVKLFFYGAGIVSGEKDTALYRILEKSFPSAVIECNSDLLAACRAVWGSEAGIAAIMGTGSNSCYYDGMKIVRNVRPGGFILGDEGSGASLGRRFLSDLLRNLVPDEVAEDFSEHFDTDYGSIVRNVYGSSAPSSYLASFAPFLLERSASSDYLRGLILDNFRDFAGRVLPAYDRWRDGNGILKVGVTGSFACACTGYLDMVGKEFGVDFCRFVATPANELLKYHYERELSV